MTFSSIYYYFRPSGFYIPPIKAFREYSMTLRKDGDNVNNKLGGNMPTTKRIISKANLRRWRRAKGFTQKQAAEELGVHVQAYRAWEQANHTRQVPFRLTKDPRFKNYVTNM
jgi:DNA-binding XRE family transcriptional regulator